MNTARACACIAIVAYDGSLTSTSTGAWLLLSPSQGYSVPTEDIQ